ncbi:hypothetical protein GCM10029992_66980 [Glycomyces albus]
MTAIAITSKVNHSPMNRAYPRPGTYTFLYDLGPIGGGVRGRRSVRRVVRRSQQAGRRAGGRAGAPGRGGRQRGALEAKLTAVAYQATDHSRQAVGEVLALIADTLARYENRLGDVEKARLDAYAQLRIQLSGVADISEDLRDQTGRLLTALKSPQVRGQWGEVQLRRIVESAGMIEHCDFSQQQAGEVDGRAVRPDLVVRLSGERTIVVDAKARSRPTSRPWSPRTRRPARSR